MILLYINDTLCDYINEKFEITKQNSNLSNINDRVSWFTTDIVLPLTPTNNRIFGNAYDIMASNTIVYDELKAVLSDDGNIFYEGIAVLDSIDKDGYHINIIGDNYEFFKQIKDVNLRDLNFSEYDIELSNTNVVNTNALVDGIKFPLIDYTENKGLYNELNNYEVGQPNGIYVPIKALQPAVFVKNVVDKIFSTFGWTFEGLFTSFDRYDKLLMVLDKQYYNFEMTDNTSYQAGIVTTNIIPDNFKAIADEQKRYSNNSFIVKKTYTHTVVVSFNITNHDSNSIFVRLYRNGILLSDTLVDVSTDGLKTLYLSESLNENDVVTLQFYYALSPINQITTINSISFKAYIPYFIDVSLSMPDWKCNEFLTAVMDVFGLYSYADVYARKLYFYSLQDVYTNSIDSDDWTQLVDMSEQVSIKLKPDNYTKYNNLFKYTHDSDTTTTQDGYINRDTSKSDSKTVLTSKFGATKEVSKGIGETIPLISVGTFPNNDRLDAMTYQSFTPRLVLDNVHDSINTVIYQRDIGVWVERTQNIAFCKTTTLDWGSETETDTLIYDYYRYLSYVLDDYKAIEIKCKLSAQQFADLDFTKPVFLKQFGNYFFKNKVTFVNDELATVELIKL